MNDAGNDSKKYSEKPQLLYWIPMTWNGLTLLVMLIVRLTFYGEAVRLSMHRSHCRISS